MPSEPIHNKMSDLLQKSGENNGFRIKIIGVGGAGNNVVDRLKLDNLDHVHYAVVNTDSQVLQNSPLQEKVLLGRAVTRGFGTGGEAEIGKKVADTDTDLLRKMVSGIDLVVIVAGLGGGTGSGVAPVLAEIAAEEGAVVISFVTLPFTFEGSRRHQQSEDALKVLRTFCHAVIPLPNDILMQQLSEEATVLDAFALADSWVDVAVRSIWSMINRTGLINVDFATVKRAFENRGGKTLFGVGRGHGADFVTSALDDLMLCPLLHTPEFSRRADSLIVQISGGTDLTMTKVNEIMTFVMEKFGSRENTILGASIDEDMKGKVEICVIGTTDVDGRRRSIRPVQKQAVIEEDYEDVQETAGNGEPKSVHVSKLDRQKDGTSQNEFEFYQEEEQRGFFEKTEKNLFDGEDLDVPTYIRRGIKIAL